MPNTAKLGKIWLAEAPEKRYDYILPNSTTLQIQMHLKLEKEAGKTTYRLDKLE